MNPLANTPMLHYPHDPLRYDEMLDSAQQPRDHWRALLAQLANEAPSTMQHRLHTMQRQVRENGVTYNVYADPQGSQRPWALDILPLILSQQEWQQIEAAVMQRAGLMNRILQDIYGAQNLITEGLLPAPLIYGNPGYLRPCHGILQGQQIALHNYAVDLARTPGGQWVVVGERTQAPSGAAYALENRNIIARAFPDVYRELKVRDLTGFFSTLRDSLDHWGRMAAAYGQGSRPLRDSEQPLMVLLTPGPYNETYSEQSYLARYLGFALVEGNDLTVRNGMVWMKTLSGLQRVHVVLRRLDDDFCDPLELRADSTLGVVGLTEAARRGNVVLANSLGTNVLESGALLGYLPRLCEHVLGEKLKMPSVGTWWCGEPEARAHVLANLDSLVIKSAHTHRRTKPLFAQDLSELEKAQLRADLQTRPEDFIAQEQVLLSQTPLWDGKLRPAAVGLRVFACATPNGYIVMPGGLARVASGADGRIINMQQGGASKDTWVAGGGKARPLHLLHHATTSLDLNRGDSHLSSRVVDNFFWFGRYAERCEHIVRISRNALDMRLQVAPEQRGGEWQAMLNLCVRFGLLDARFAQPSQGTNGLGHVLEHGLEHEAGHDSRDDEAIESMLIRSVLDPKVTGLASNLRGLFGVAFHLRERLSQDNWRKLNQMVQQAEMAGEHRSLQDAMLILEESATSLVTLSGFALDGMTRDQGWRFLSMGRWVERVQFLCSNLLDAIQLPPGCRLDWLLELADSIVTYRSRYMAAPEWLPMLDLLLLDDTNPRSVVFQLQGLIKYLRKLEQSHGPCGAEILLPLSRTLHHLQPERDLRRDSKALAQLLHDIQEASNQIAHKIESRFFSNTEQHGNAATAQHET